MGPAGLQLGMPGRQADQADNQMNGLKDRHTDGPTGRRIRESSTK
jgi:hypothetical protein